MSPEILTAQAVADLVGGRLSGDGAVPLGRVRSLERARPDELAVCSGPRFRDALAASRAGAVLLPPECADDPGPATRIIVDDPMRAMVRVATALEGSGPPAGIDPSAQIGTGVRLGAGCRVAAGVVIGDGVTIGDRTSIGPLTVIEAAVTVGADVALGPRVVVHHGSRLGDRVVCKAGAVIGGPGFGFLSSADGHARVPQVGGCHLEDDVEIGSNSCIDRGSLDDTVIGRGTKIDNLVHVAHNVRIGRNCLLMAGVGVSGSTRIGDGVILAGHSGVVGHVQIGDGARIGGQAGVISSVAAGESVSGFPARPHLEFLRAQVALYRLAPHVAALEALLRREQDD